MVLARDRGWDVEGVESSAKAADLARARGLRIHHGVLSDVRLSDRAFDVVTLWEVLDWMERPASELREVARVLKDGGALFVRVRNGPIHVLIWRLGRLLSLDGLGGLAVVHRHGFSARTLRKSLEQSGFDRVRVGNSRLALGNAYSRRLSAAARAASRLARSAWTAVSCSLRVLSAGRFLAGASLVARGRKPDRRVGRDAR
jgi:SAM-dependent methyltransferase